MKDNATKFTGLITIISGAIVAIFAVIKDAKLQGELAATVAFYTVLGIFVILLIANIVILIVKHRLQVRSRELLDTSSILARSNKVAKDLKKVIKEVDKTIQKYIRKHKTLTGERKNELEIVKRNIKIIADYNRSLKKKKAKKNLTYFAKIKAGAVISTIKNGEYSHHDIVGLNETVITSIKEMERALLVLEQYETRIFLGDYVLTHSTDVIECARALMDYKGWTHSLLGKTDLFKKEVQDAIDMLKQYQSDSNNLEKAKKDEIALLIARGNRHLGSDVISMHKNAKKAKEDLEKTEDNFLKHHNCEKPENLGAFGSNELEMYAGIRYGIYNAELIILKDKETNSNDSDKCRGVLENIVELQKITKIASGFANPHRYIKCVLLENEYLKYLETIVKNNCCVVEDNKASLKKIFGESDNYAKTVFETFVSNTKLVENKFKQAIYVDEMMEIYINQEVNQLFKKIEEIVNK